MKDMKSQMMLTTKVSTVKYRRSKWQGVAIDILQGCEEHDFATLACGRLEEDFAAHYFNRRSSDANVYYAVIDARGTNKNPAGPLHLHALFNQDAFIAFGYPVTDHPGCGTTGSGAGRRIFAVVKEHAGVKPGFAIKSFAADEIKKFARSLSEIFRRAVEIDPQILYDRV
jgi:hypothetical protein